MRVWDSLMVAAGQVGLGLDGHCDTFALVLSLDALR